MNKSNKYSPEVKERAVRIVEEQRSDYPSLWSTVESIAPKIGCSACQSAFKFDHPSASNFDQGKGVIFSLISYAV